MDLRYTPTFKKQYRKLPASIQRRFDERIDLFMTEPLHPLLRVHPLLGRFRGYWSMNVTGDVRALFKREADEVITFGLIGTHSELYG
jgi:addiction module RelE/StbE family toxin